MLGYVEPAGVTFLHVHNDNKCTEQQGTEDGRAAHGRPVGLLVHGERGFKQKAYDYILNPVYGLLPHYSHLRGTNGCREKYDRNIAAHRKAEGGEHERGGGESMTGKEKGVRSM